MGQRAGTQRVPSSDTPPVGQHDIQIKDQRKLNLNPSSDEKEDVDLCSDSDVSEKSDSSTNRLIDFPLRLNLNPSSDEDLCSDSGVSMKSDSSNDCLNNIIRERLVRQHPSEHDDCFRGQTDSSKDELNLNPSSDEDLFSDSGVSEMSDMSNDRFINFPLRRRRHPELSSQDRSQSLVGALVGVVMGGLMGSLMGGQLGTLVGALVGALVGGLVGRPVK
ncbi:clumping factor A-like [Cebidichthys violaceus]|uniref:clumping factor A-like n=1 Tax=Cebidichthys violaceus TaxID=271503 RepID=UPI0035CA29AA